MQRKCKDIYVHPRQFVLFCTESMHYITQLAVMFPTLRSLEVILYTFKYIYHRVNSQSPLSLLLEPLEELMQILTS